MAEYLDVKINGKFVASWQTNDLETLMNDYYELLKYMKDKKIIKSFELNYHIYELE